MANSMLVDICYPFKGTLRIAENSVVSGVVKFIKQTGHSENFRTFGLSLKLFRKLQLMPIWLRSRFVTLDFSQKAIWISTGLKGGMKKSEKDSEDRKKIISSASTSYGNAIWVDRNIFNEENVKYFNATPTNIFIKRFNLPLKAIDYINSYRRQKLILILSGSIGEEILSKITYEYILTVIIFCFDVDKHSVWAMNYPIVSHVVNSYPEVLSLIQSSYLTQTENIRHTHFTPSGYSSFYKLTGKVIDSEMVNKDAIAEELTQLNTKEKNTILKTLEMKKQVLAEAVIYLYTTNLIYKQFNKAFKNDELHKVVLSAALCLKDVMTNQKYHFEGEYMYRGIPSIDLSTYKNALNSSRPLFFPGFVSASQSKNEARKFAGAGGTILKIKLNKDKPYPHVRLTEGMSKFDYEHEVILMSYIPLYVKKMNEKKKKVWLEQFSYLTVTVNFKDLSVQEILDVEDFITVKCLKKMIKTKRGIPLKIQRLLNNQQNLENDSQIKSLVVSQSKIELDLWIGDYHKIRGLICYIQITMISSPSSLLRIKLYSSTGKKIVFSVQNSLTCLQLKQLILSYFPCEEELALLYQLNAIDDRLSIADCLNIFMIDVLVCKVARIDMKIFAKNRNGEPLDIEIGSSNTILYLKAEIEKRGILTAAKQDLIFNGDHLKDDRSLADYNIQDMSVIDILDQSIGTEPILECAFYSEGFQFFIKLPDGQVIKMYGEEEYTITKIKKKIQNKSNIPVLMQRLLFEGRELENDLSLEHYNVSEGSSVRLVQASESRIEVITNFSGNSFRLTVSSYGGAQEIKCKIQEKLGIPLEQQTLFFGNKKLEGEQILSDYSIHNNAGITLMLRFEIQNSLTQKILQSSTMVYKSSDSFVLMEKVNNENISPRKLHSNYIAICVSKDKRFLLFVDEKTLYARYFETGEYLLIENDERFANSNLMLSVANMLVLVHSEVKISVFTLFPSFNIEWQMDEQEKKISCIEASLDGSLIFTADKIIKVWLTFRKSFSFELKGHSCSVTCMKVTASNNSLVSGSGDRNIIIWSISNRCMIYQIKAHNKEIRGLDVSEDEKLIISGAQDGCMKIWDMNTRDLLLHTQESSWVNFVEISSNKKYAFLGLNNGEVKQKNLAGQFKK